MWWPTWTCPSVPNGQSTTAPVQISGHRLTSSSSDWRKFLQGKLKFSWISWSFQDSDIVRYRDSAAMDNCCHGTFKNFDEDVWMIILFYFNHLNAGGLEITDGGHLQNQYSENPTYRRAKVRAEHCWTVLLLSSLLIYKKAVMPTSHREE